METKNELEKKLLTDKDSVESKLTTLLIEMRETGVAGISYKDFLGYKIAISPAISDLEDG